MYDSQLMDIVRTFSKDDFAALKQFVRSPFLNHSSRAQAVISLFEVIAATFPDCKKESLQRDKVYQKTFPGDEVIEGRLEKVMTELLKVLRRYIVYTNSHMEENSVSFQMTLAKYYRNKGLETRFLSTIDKLRQQSNGVPQPDTTDLYQRFRIEEILHDHRITHYQKKGDANLVETIQRLDTYYMAERLVLTGALFTIKSHTTFDQAEMMHMVHAISSYMDKGFQADHPIIRGFYLAAVIIHQDYQDCEAAFGELRSLLENYRDILPMDYQKNLGSCCRNYCTRQINTGNSDYYAILFEMIQTQLASGILYHLGGLAPPTLQNIVNAGLKMKAFDWVKELLDTHRHRIVGSHHPEQVYHFNLSNYYFHAQKYDEALELLAGSYEDIHYNLRAKCTEIKIFYEKQELNFVESKVEAFKVYILRLFPQYISENTKTSYLNFVYLLKKIITPSTLHNAKRQSKLLAEAGTLPNLVDRDWFVEKIGALK